MGRPTLRYELEWKNQGHLLIAGIDEAGRGPLAGPVCAAAVMLPDGFEHDSLNDSKQLSEGKRERIYEEITVMPELMWSVAMIHAEEIDRINILRATHAAMAQAVLALVPAPNFVLIDGRPVPGFPLPSQALVKGDSLSLSIAAASVIAKVTRDRFMIAAARKYSAYGFETHKGYGTRGHLAALRQHGPCPLHRRSFEPVYQLTLAIDEA
ncbi:MAG: ribonuclease HII [Verrucomicrobia bacterium]|nr:ribonuclease HII [Verrucomicrobiota bacterium]